MPSAAKGISARHRRTRLHRRRHRGCSSWHSRAGALAGSLAAAALIATLGARKSERAPAIGAILASGMGIGILLLSYHQGFASASTNILFGNVRAGHRGR